MNRPLLLRRCSMSSIEEEDESIVSDEPAMPMVTEPSEQLQPFPFVSEWDSEFSESEQEEFDESFSRDDDDEEQAANRALQHFIQASLRTHQIPNDETDKFPPTFADDDGASHLDILMSEFDPSFSSPCPTQVKHVRPSNGCVRDLRTLEDQLEAALASLTFTINETSATMHAQQRSSDSSASSSGVGEEMGSEAFNLYTLSDVNQQQPETMTVQLTSAPAGDDVDSAFSDSGSTDKVLGQSHHDEALLYRSMVPSTGLRPEATTSMFADHDDSLVSTAQHTSKILVRTYNDDGSTKSIFIDDSMNIRDVLFVLIHKNHREPHIDYVLVEILPDLQMERIFEDHQKLAEAILMWPTISSNRLNFTKRSEKYSLFRTITSENGFLPAPDTEGTIYLKEKSRKSWKKHFCVLRSSGLYFLPKGKSKKDLVCLAKFENVELFFGLDWKKKFKSPSEFCFALKHPLIQKKSSKYIKYMCVENKTDFERWIVNIRIAKFGQQLKMNYLFMEKAMNIYRASGRFVALCPTRVQQQPPPERRQTEDLIMSSSRYQPLHSIACVMDEYEDRSPIKSASYMDELRQRLERVVNDPPSASLPSNSIAHRPTLMVSPKLKSSLESTDQLRRQKATITLGSTPLPRKQFPSIGSHSYRTANFSSSSRQPSQSTPMSKSFIIPSKRDDHQSASSLSTSDSVNLDEADCSSTRIRATKPRLNGGPPPKLSSLHSPRLSNSSSCTSKITPVTSLKALPLVPPRKSSICAVKCPRDVSNHQSFRRPHISHL